MNLDSNEYKGFEIIEKKYIADCTSNGIYLRHKKTGLEVFHLLNNDKENLCAFCFRTPPEKSNGVAHIMEHSVLCGSQKYPIKDPFIHLENQSLKTFLNAMTGSDKTLYPVSSVVEEDYFNLFSVYADSVFFPELKKEAFMQEGWHLEKNEKDEYSIQGVVYNEMKGVYSSFDSVCSDVVQSSVLCDTIYELDSGGCPLVIPELTYEQYLDFHKKNYSPNNCLLFLYGNIPTQKQLDFLQKEVLDKIELSYDLQDESYALKKIKNIKPPVFSQINKVQAYAPSVLNSKKEEDPSVIVSWRLTESSNLYDYVETGILNEVLTSHDGSPITKALLDSGLGNELASCAGFDSTTKYIYLSFGLDGVKKSKTQKVYDVIIEQIQKLILSGVNQDDIDCAIMDYEFSLKEVVRHSGPFSLVLMKRVLSSWIYGKNPFEFLFIQQCFDKIKSNIKSDPNYFTKLLKKYFIDNNQCGISVVTPSPKYAQEFQKQEQLQIEKLKTQISDAKLLEQTKQLREFQTKDETQLLSCLPHIDARNIKYQIPQVKTDFSLLKYSEDGTVPFALNIENTNGIDYVKVSFPYDVLSVDEYDYVPFLMYVLTEIGWAGKTWYECSSIVNKYSGNFGCASLTSSTSKTKRAQILEQNFLQYNLINREWFSISVKMLHEKIQPCLQFFAECISKPDFSDLKRLKNLFDEFLSDYESSVTTSGHFYMASRSMCLFNRCKATDEINGGLENLIFLRTVKNDIKTISKKLSIISKKIFSSGAVIHLICDNDSKGESIEQIKKLAKNICLKIPEQKNINTTDELIYKKVNLFYKNSSLEIFQKNIQIGFAAASCKSSCYGTKEAVAESVFAHWLSNSLLWEQIRTVCGAYGAQATVDSVEQIFSIYTYRDPNPYKSLQVIQDCLQIASQKQFTQDEIKKAITGCFSNELKPRTPKVNGTIGFERMLYCIDQEDVNERIKSILLVSAEDVHNAACRIYDKFMKDSHKSILNPKKCKITSKVQKKDI